MAKKVDFLVSRTNGSYAFRRRYPLDLAHLFPEPFRWLSLETRSAVQAKVLVRAKAADFDCEMERLRVESRLAKDRLLREADIPALTERFAACALHTDEVERNAGLSESEWEEQGELIDTALKAGKNALARGDAGYMEDSVSDLLERERYSAPTGELLRALCLAVLKADIGALTELDKRQQGEVVETPSMPVAPGVRAGEGLHGEAGYLEKVFEAWKGAVHPEDKTACEAEAALAEFVALCGGNTHVLPWSGKLARTHPGGLDLPRSHLLDIKRADAMRFKRQLLKKNGIATVQKKLGLLSAMVSLVLHAEEDDAALPRNPFANLWTRQELKDGGKEKPRVNFSVAQLQRIFNSPIYTDPGYLASLCDSAGGDAAYWMWLVATFSGARLEELGRLTSDNFEKINGRYLFHVRCGKTGNARRIVPVHRTLEELGFVDFALHCKGRVFLDLLPDCRGALTGNFSKWANEYLDNVVGITDKRLVFHSTCHTVKHFLRGNVLKEINDYIAGHSRHDVGDDYGGESYPIPPLIDAIDKLAYEGLNLSHLKRWTPKKGAQ